MNLTRKEQKEIFKHIRLMTEDFLGVKRPSLANKFSTLNQFIEQVEEYVQTLPHPEKVKVGSDGESLIVTFPHADTSADACWIALKNSDTHYRGDVSYYTYPGHLGITELG